MARNTQIHSLLITSESTFHQIYFIETQQHYGGAEYIADETNSELYNSSDSITASSECFFQLLALFPEILR